METVYDGGGGLSLASLGTAGSVCAINPQDTAQVLNNLLTRIEDLEFQLSQIVGANLHTNTLGDISSQVGWVYGVEYMGTPGWIRTEAGTLIPPPGFTILGSGMTLSDGNTYNAVLMDSDGILQYGFTNDGQILGNSSSPSAYAIFSSGTATGGTSSNPPQVYLKNVSEVSNSFTTAHQSTPFAGQSAVWNIERNGLYLINISAHHEIDSTTPPAYAGLTFTVQATPGLLLLHTTARRHATDDADEEVNESFSCPLRAEQGDQVTITIIPSLYGGGTAAGYRLTNIYVSLICVSSL